MTEYVVRIAWRGRYGKAGSASEATVFPAPNGEVIAVSAGPAPAAAIGFDVLAGESEPTLTVQNSSLIAVGQTWTMPLSGLVGGLAPAAEQQPDHYIRRNRAR